MSLATTGGGAGMAGGGGMAMSAGAANHAQALAMPAGAPPPPQGGHIPGSGAAPPVSAAALGADLIDKSQHALSQKQARSVAHLPIVAIDLHASEPHVAMFPPKMGNGGFSAPPEMVGKMKADLYFHGDSETAHKVLRKYLTKSKPFLSLQAEAMANADAKDAVKMERPQQWLGLRRTSDAPKHLQKKLPKGGVESTGGNFVEEDSVDVGVTISNSTLDGSAPLGDDFDRVVFKTRVHPKKKALAVLPEEGVQMLCHQAQYHVAKKVKADKEDEEILDYPCAISVPAWQCNDAAVEALMDGMGGSGVVFQRSVCALVGALRPGPQDKPNLLLKAINEVRTERMKAFQIVKAKNPDATMEEDVSLFAFGMTNDGVECTAFQVCSLQPDNVECLFGDIKVLSNVAYQADDPSTVIEKCIKELRDNLQSSSMADIELPPAIAVYGSTQQQNTIKEKWEAIKNKSVSEWKDIPILTTKSDCVAMGTAVLGGVSHGRLRTIQQVQGKKPKAILAIRVANVAPVAVGVRMNYHGDNKKKWTPVKTIFDFDRRVPAGPYAIDLKASECAVHREATSELSDEEFLKAAKANEGSKGIPKREEAASNFRLQIYQKWSRDGEWKKVGDVKKALVVVDRDEKEIACEHAVLELSLGPTGIITAGLHGEG